MDEEYRGRCRTEGRAQLLVAMFEEFKPSLSSECASPWSHVARRVHCTLLSSLSTIMKIRNAFELFVDLRAAVQAALIPTLRALVTYPFLLFRPVDLSRIFMSHVWATFGDSVDEGGRVVKEALICSNAQGAVFDIGAGESSISYNSIRPKDILFAQDTATRRNTSTGRKSQDT